MNKIEYVDPLIGSVGEVDDNEACHGGGKVHPGACVPGGLVQLSPDTVTAGDNGTGYNYCHNTIEGFSFNHMSGIGWYGDLGNLQIMPVTGETDLRSGSNAEVPFEKGTLGWKSPFSHENECAKAGYYSVFLDRYSIKAEATVSERTGMLKVTYPAKSEAKLIFNFSRRIGGKADFQYVEAVDTTTFKGYIKCTPAGGGFGRGQGNISYTLYFYIKLSHAPKEIKFFENEEIVNTSGNSHKGEDVGMLTSFGKLNQPLTVSVGLSYTDLEGAQKNFEAENTNFDFEKMYTNAQKKWENIFSCIDVDGENSTDLTLFYTCLYHTLLDPRIMADVDGRYKTPDESIQQSTYTHRTMFSGWDVYRSEFPLLTLIRPDIVNDTVNSLLNIALQENSSMPKWELMGIDSGCMVGDPALLVTADAFVKGIRNFDTEKAYAVSLASSNCSKELFGKEFHSVRPEDFKYTDIYLKEAYVPYRLSLTLELLAADYAMYKFAQATGQEKDAQYFLDRAKRYKENYNTDLGFLAPRDENGEFLFLDEGMYDTDGCVESNILQQTWFVPYDVEGLLELFGKDRASELLESFFDKADLSALWNDDYNHSNEPCHNITHYFNILGKPHRTQYWTRKVQKESYRLGAFGFCGNEDVGQLSAWYVLSALGFAQICPAVPIYQLNTPLFKKAKIKLSKEYHGCSTADTLEIVCDKSPLDYPYIKEVYLNGNKINCAFVTYEALTNGGRLDFILCENPCKI